GVEQFPDRTPIGRGRGVGLDRVADEGPQRRALGRRECDDVALALARLRELLRRALEVRREPRFGFLVPAVGLGCVVLEPDHAITPARHDQLVAAVALARPPDASPRTDLPVGTDTRRLDTRLQLWPMIVDPQCDGGESAAHVTSSTIVSGST